MAKDFNPGGQKGKLHKELGVDPKKTIPKDKLKSAENSKNPEIKRDAKRAEVMAKWKKK